MPCKSCQTKPVWKFTNKTQLCATHFVRYFEKKIFYTIRKFKLFSRKDKIGIFLENKNSITALAVMQKFAKRNKNPLIIFKENFSEQLARKHKITKIVVGDTLDNEAEEIIMNLLQSRKNKKVKNKKSIPKVKPLLLLLDKEAKLYYKIKKLHGSFFAKQKKQDKLRTEIHKFLCEMEKQHPEIKNAVVKGFVELR